MIQFKKILKNGLFLFITAGQTTYANRSRSFSVTEGIGWVVFEWDKLIR
jgi:hypothetical protein